MAEFKRCAMTQISLTEQVRAYIQAKNLITKNTRVLVAVSGGLDSMALLHLMLALSYDVEAAHVNYHLRGSDSEKDEKMVRDTCLKWGVPLHVKSIELSEELNESKSGLQETAREERYEYFEQIRLNNKCSHIATAHHMDDNIETVLINMIRGSGLNGLSGIPSSNGYIVRPLLSSNKSQLEHYVRAQNINWRMDRSNASDQYVRNRIRNRIIPEFEAIRPGFKKSMAKTIQNVKASEQALLRYSQVLRDQYFNIQIPYIIVSLDDRNENRIDPSILYLMLNIYGFNVDQCRDLLTAQSGAIVESNVTYYVAHKDRDSIIIHTNFLTPPAKVTLNNPDTTYSNGISDLKIELSTNIDYTSESTVECINADRVKWPLTWRPWQKGDRFQPIGMNGRHKKIQDYYTDKKVGYIKNREGTVLVNGNGEIIWLVGHRLDERYKVNEGDKKIIRVSLK
jgi:tRNA(Ile)-lysidine synthase